MPPVFNKQATLVLLGQFYVQALQDPQWVKTFLFPEDKQQKIQVGYSFGANRELVARMSVGGIELAIDACRLQFTPATIDSSGFDALSDLVGNFSRALPLTMLNAYGVNFGMLFSGNKRILSGNVPLMEIVGDNEHHGTLSFRYSVPYSDGILNATVFEETVDDIPRTRLDFNFHFKLNPNEKTPIMVLKNALIDGQLQQCFEHAKHIAESMFPEEMKNA